jgi:hypothetical protein
LGGSWDSFGEPWGVIWECFWAVSRKGRSKGSSGPDLRGFGVHFGGIWEPFWRDLGAILESFWKHVGEQKRKLGIKAITKRVY